VPPPVADDWWRQAAVYQIYPRSFADGSGDGIGDLAGVLDRVDYLAALNIDAVWFSPFYPSALFDGGYDVDDYRDIDPRIGTLDQFDQVVAALHDRNIQIIVDIVPNHCSERHEWFVAALAAAPGSAARDRFIFRDGLGDDGSRPPADWQSMFGGPAWTRITEPDGTPGQWYLHLFTTHQPDWNWDNAEVREDFLRTLRFWSDRGVDGFRVDVASALAKDLTEPLAPWADLVSGHALLPSDAPPVYADGQHPLFDRDEVDEIYRTWRAVFNEYDPPRFAVAEAWVAPHRRRRYASPTSLGQAFNFDLLSAPWSATAFRTTIERNLELELESGSTSTWVLSNHDVVRHATRYALPGAQENANVFDAGRSVDGQARAQGLARAKAATLLCLALPGSAYLYQGEELGLPEVHGIPAERAQDPMAIVEDGVVVIGRDGCRIPLPWTAHPPYFGFSEQGSHLPQPDWFGSYSVATEAADSQSTLSLYREALRLRHELQADEDLSWLDLGPDVVAFRRANGWTSVTNFGAASVELPAGEVLLRTDGEGRGPLAADTTAWLQTG
jgi:alpha-glucosidase